MAQQVFKRIEKKYMLTRPQREALLQAFQGHMQRDAFGRHTICNLYLDTDDYALTRRSIEKPLYKEKLRLRAYGVPGPEDTVFLELKKKYKGVVYKRRMELTCRQARDYLLRGKRPDLGSQIAHALDAQRIFPCSYSKVGTVYEQFIQPTIQWGGSQTCSQVS